jgi:uncharacterized protein
MTFMFSIRILRNAKIARCCCCLLATAFVTAANSAPAQVRITNAPSRWLSRQEVQKKWADTPLEAVKQAAERGDLTARHYLGLCYALGDRVAKDPVIAMAWYQRASDAGYLPSTSNLGLLYYQGQAVSKDLTKATQLFRIAAEAGLAQGQENLGFSYRDGLGVPRDLAEAMKWFRRAADQGHTGSMVDIGRMYRSGRGLPKDLNEAIKWFTLASDKGDPLGTVNLGWLYGFEETAPKDEVKAFRLYLKAAEQGQPDALYELYFSYNNGSGVAEDRVEARNWLAKAAEAGLADAQCELGFYNEAHIGWIPYYRAAISNNMPEAVKWYRLAVDQGSARGKLLLGYCYIEGRGVEKDEERGLELVRQAADQEHGPSLFELARLYAKGIGEPRSETERPINLLRRAAAMDVNNAFEDLELRYLHGLGTDRDLVEAARWYCRAAVSGLRGYPLKDKTNELSLDKTRQTDPFLVAVWLYLKAAQPTNTVAAMQIGEMYSSGRDAPQNPAKAWVWLTIAAQNGSAKARAKVIEMEPRMSSDELKEARELLPGFIKELNQVASAVRGISERATGQ